MRIFVALDIAGDVHRALEAFVACLKPVAADARWVRPEGMHITVKFLGEVSPEKVERIEGELAMVRSETAVDMQFRGVGFFPNERQPRVFWVGVEASPNLAELAADIETRLEKLGIPREGRAFRPHLTLARFTSTRGLDRLREALAASPPGEFGRMRTDRFHLYQSRLWPGGAVYTKLATWRFVGGRG